MTRVPWPEEFPEVLVNAPYSSGNKRAVTLKQHPLYAPAKGERDMRSALQVVDDLAQREVIEALADIAAKVGQVPLVIAPSAQPGDSNNALAIGYAEWLGHELRWDVESRVFQTKEVSRDRQGNWFRLAHGSKFDGEIDTARPYVIVDDVITLGGTLADLRSFIVRKGGRVIAMSALASNNGSHKPIRLSDETSTRLEGQYGSNFPHASVGLFGFPSSCLTELEGQACLACSGLADLRTRILRER